ncbi:MAG: hypothetical protein U0234_10775 [Sandaracinus sp.]
MATLIERIDDTRSHLARESLALVTRTRRAGDGLARALASEAHEWRIFVVSRRDLVRTEAARLSSPRGFERALLRLADDALARAHGTVHARLSTLEKELAPKRAPKTKKARPAAKRSRSVSRKLVSEPTA